MSMIDVDGGNDIICAACEACGENELMSDEGNKPSWLMDAGVVVGDGSIEPISIMAIVGTSIVSPISTPEDINSSGCDHNGGSYEEKHRTNPFRTFILYCRHEFDIGTDR
mmetsp:Transcript_13185/g.20364  ORF Transcript_13185/g.20364 Transcript_13185/m.20364 type:complete len:110 (+) Transcript_13185:1083-1412(+)